MSEDNSGWPANPGKPDSELAPLAPLARGNEPGVRDAHGRFLSGNSGGGRKKGSRNRLTEVFLAAIESDFAAHGPDALAKLRDDDPSAYLRIVASLVPRDLILKREQSEDYSELSPQELDDFMQRERQNGMIAKWISKARDGF